jgi:hypothetical protein
MIRAKYRDDSIVQQAEFGPLRLLKWGEGGPFIITKHGGNVAARCDISDRRRGEESH